MKRYLIIFALLVAFLPFLKGQKFTAQGGLVISDVLFYVDSVTIETNKNFGYVIGIDREINLVENLYQGIGFEFVQKGFRIKSSGNDFNLRINYVNFPFNARYKFDLEDFFMTFEAGPFLSIAFPGKRTTNGEVERLKFGSNEGQFAYFDYGFNLGYTIEADYLKFRIAYNVGLKDIASSQLEKIKNRSFAFSIGIVI